MSNPELPVEKGTSSSSSLLLLLLSSAVYQHNINSSDMSQSSKLILEHVTQVTQAFGRSAMNRCSVL